MAAYVLRRVLWMIPTFFGITVLTFAIAHLAPGDPLMLAGENPGAAAAWHEAIDEFRREQGLDRPLPEQYLRWLGRLATLDFGRSTQDHRPVMEKIGEALPRTVGLTGGALALAIAAAIPLGVFSAVRRRTLGDRLVGGSLFFLYSMPGFWLATLLLLAFAGELRWFPMQGLTSDDFHQLGPWEKVADVLWHAVLPIICLSYAVVAALTRYVRAAMIDVLHQDYVRTARAKGLPERVVVYKHALRNAVLPVIAWVGMVLPQVLGGSVILERIFGIPGMGLLAVEAIFYRDYPTVMGITTLVAILTMVSTLLADLLQAAADPRVAGEVVR